MRNLYFTTEQTVVIRDLALTMLQKPGRSRAAVLASILTGNLNDLEPQEYRDTMVNLISHAAGSSLDVIGEIVGLAREIVEYHGGRSPETDTSFAERLKAEICYLVWNRDAKLVGVSLRTALHFHAFSTLAQREAVIRKIIPCVKEGLESIEVGGTFRINDLCLVIRCAATFIIDIGQPNRPFEKVLLWRDGKPEPLLDNNYVVQPGEQLTLERSIPVPIDFRDASRNLDVELSPAIEDLGRSNVALGHPM